MGYPGSYGHEVADAKQFAAWGVDSLKMDGCNLPPNASYDVGFPGMYRIFYPCGSHARVHARPRLVPPARTFGGVTVGFTRLAPWMCSSMHAPCHGRVDVTAEPPHYTQVT